MSRLDSPSKRDRTGNTGNAWTHVYLRVTFLESNVFSVVYTHTYIYIAIEDTRISARIYRWIVTDQRRDEKGEAGSLGGIFASERLFHDDVISHLWRFLS